MKRAFKLLWVKTFVAIGYVLSLTYIAHKIFYSNIYPYILAGFYGKQMNKAGKNLTIGSFFNLFRGGKHITIGDNVSIGRGVRLTAWSTYNSCEGLQKFTPKIIIGNNCSIGDSGHITAIDMIQFGNNVLLGPKVLITDNTHGVFNEKYIDVAPNRRPLNSKGPVIIEDNVWIGEKASIMPGVRIGYGSIVAANSVVTKDVPKRSIVAGIPAKVIRSI